MLEVEAVPQSCIPCIKHKFLAWTPCERRNTRAELRRNEYVSCLDRQTPLQVEEEVPFLSGPGTNKNLVVIPDGDNFAGEGQQQLAADALFFFITHQFADVFLRIVIFQGAKDKGKICPCA
jgi:hypothetical protein